VISAKVIADSRFVDSEGDHHRLTTMVLVYPRFIHSEFMTHRVFSRNAASSRAIPIQKMMDAVRDDPAMPIYWGRNQAGMQAGQELEGDDLINARAIWLEALEDALYHARALSKTGLHKQVVNRILEPWMHMQTIVSATEWENFYALRTDAAAQPEIRALALAMLVAHNDSQSRIALENEWHLPFTQGVRFSDHPGFPDALYKSVAHCARVSYTRQYDDSTAEKDKERHDSLLASGHFSPFEHQAQAGQSQGPSGNFKGWTQYRHMLASSSFAEFEGLLR
jgi:thymidylate synthase ThyX